MREAAGKRCGSLPRHVEPQVSRRVGCFLDFPGLPPIGTDEQLETVHSGRFRHGYWGTFSDENVPRRSKGLCEAEPCYCGWQNKVEKQEDRCTPLHHTIAFDAATRENTLSRTQFSRAINPTPASSAGATPFTASWNLNCATLRIMRVLLVTPPMIQLNTPYPATPYLMGFLRLHAADLGLELTQADASLALFLRLFSAPRLARMADVLRRRARPPESTPRSHLRSLIFLSMPGVTSTRWSRPFASCNTAIRAWHFVSSGAHFFPKGHVSSTEPATRGRACGARRAAAVRVRHTGHDGAGSLPREPVHRRPRRRLAESASTRASSSRATASDWPQAPRRSNHYTRR